MIVRLATHADRLPKSSQRRSCLLAEPKDTAKSLDEAISVQPLVNSRGAGLAYDFFRFLRRPLGGRRFLGPLSDFPGPSHALALGHVGKRSHGPGNAPEYANQIGRVLAC